MQHEQTQAPVSSPAEAVLPGTTGAALETLQRARNSEGADRLELAAKLNALLRIGAREETQVWGQFLIDKLDDEAFHDLYDGEGTSCRALAVEALLSLGFPWALHLDPSDVDYLRAVKPTTTPWGGWQAMAVVTGLLALLFGLAFFIHV